jgi:large exoprotein involved in heme utilization and adhesion
LSITDDGSITTSARTGSEGDGGNITIKAADNVSISGHHILGDDIYFSGIFSETSGKGKAGDITIETGNLSITDAGRITTSARTGSEGNGGNITISAKDTVSISGHYDSGNGVYSSSIVSETSGKGRAGDITIETGNLSIADAGSITATARAGSEGKGGNLSITARDTVSISGQYDSGKGVFSSGLKSETFGKGGAGNISIDTNKLRITDAALITTRAREGSKGDGGNIVITARAVNISGFYETLEGLYPSGIFSETSSSGNGGAITVSGQSIYLKDRGLISASSTGTGNAGNISISAGDIFSVDNASVETSSMESVGGNIRISGRAIQMTNGGWVSASVASGEGGGGNVDIDTTTLAALEGSAITARADLGYGGNITINAKVVLFSNDVYINASSNLVGREGKIEVNSPAIDILSKLAVLQSSYLDLNALFPKQCAAREEETSSFVVRGRDGIPPQPDSLLTSP